MRISTTLLENFRRWRAIEIVPVEELEEAIRGELVQNAAMIRGGAVHDVVAYPGRYLNPASGAYVHRDRDGKLTGWKFGYQSINDLRAAIGSHLVEVKTTIELEGQTVVAKADGVTGLEVDELKIRGKQSFEPDWFVDSFQWRIYALAFGARKVTYHLITLDEPRKGEEITYIASHQMLPLFTYPAMELEIRMLVRDFVAFVRDRNLETYLGDPAT